LTQTIRFGREEFAPHLSQRNFTLVVLGAVVAGAVIWAVVKQILDDPLYLTSFTITIVWCLPSATALLMRRGSARGQSVRQYVAFTGMILSWFVCNMLVFGPPFKAFAYVLLFVVGILWGAGQAWALHRISARDELMKRVAPELRAERRIAVEAS
jgi:hypothetical protein